jgi:hypothetical protein
MSRLVRSSMAVLLAASSVAASAATLKLENGARLSIEPAALAPLELPSLGGAGVPLRFSMLEADGRQWTGEVPGSAGTQANDVTIAQNPVSGDVFTVFARPVRGGAQLMSSRWSGQGFSDPAALVAGSLDDRRPLLAFRPTGEALLGFQRGGPDGSILLGHFDLGVNGVVRTYTFVDAGAPSSFLPAQFGPDLLGAARIEGIAPVPDDFAAYVLVTRTGGSASAVLRLALDGDIDHDGFGAAPVPVTFIRSTTNSASSSQPLMPASGVSGLVIEPWRMSLTIGTAWYWTRDNAVDLVTFRGSEMGRLVSFATPATDALMHAEAFRVARAELGLGLRRPGLAGTSDPARRSR